MSDIIWRIKQFFQKLIPMILVAAVAWGGYQLYRDGFFRGGIRPTLARTVGKIPVFGSKFRNLVNGGSVASRSSYRSHSRVRGKHARRHGRRHRRH